ncbi:RICIN domain-containing protein [Actinoplanes oblitus]|uniref:RICIN domain-containing protein n=1 Tax=Actinoplanes oblitus TaxID=3040509 RepID=A0ABY8W9K9_9ACTN|nr:RICIN domain-containing protein [Actinoplanes oblitus]WIM94549.1 RICIN domain-containing protein [Actinoplanes oblitus]
MRRITRAIATLTAGFAAAAPLPAPPPLHQGWIMTRADGTRCLTGGAVGSILSTRPCSPETPGQDWFQASTGAFYNGPNCIRAEGTVVRVAACDGADPAQDWWFVSVIRSGRYGPCLTEETIDRSGTGVVRLRTCTWRRDQKWRSAS